MQDFVHQQCLRGLGPESQTGVSGPRLTPAQLGPPAEVQATRSVEVVLALGACLRLSGLREFPLEDRQWSMPLPAAAFF